MASNGHTDHKRELEVITIDDLNVDRRYQRELDQTLVERILKDWDDQAYDAIKVSRRADGALYIVNGQHTAAAAKLSGETEILAFVYEGLTVEQEADLRLKSNNRRSDTALERFHAQIVAKNPESLAILEIVEEMEGRINRSANQNVGINCVSTLERIYRIDEGRTLRLVLRAAKEAYDDIGGAGASSAAFQGVAWFVAQHQGQYQWRSLVERMQQVGADMLQTRTLAHRSVHGGDLWLNYYRSLVEAYNYRRPEHTRLETVTKRWGTMSNRGPGWGGERR